MGRPVQFDITGKRFGQLFILRRFGTQGHEPIFEAKCDCGKICHVGSCNVRHGRTKSCGCLKILRGEKNPSYKHGQTLTPEYGAYKSAKGRCNNPNVTGYERYGGRGIKFLFDSFFEWYDHLGPRPTPSHSVDRIESHSHYMPGNVRWATKSEQVKNRAKFGAITKFSVEELQQELTRRQRCTER